MKRIIRTTATDDESTITSILTLWDFRFTSLLLIIFFTGTEEQASVFPELLKGDHPVPIGNL